MPSSKLLNGVAHDIAHHALSGLSYLHPHLTQVCKRARCATVTLDLLRESPLPADFPDYEPLRLASQALHRTFIGILESVGFTVADITTARLTFHVPPEAPDDYSYISCDSDIFIASGRVYQHELPAFCTTNAASYRPISCGNTIRSTWLFMVRLFSDT